MIKKKIVKYCDILLEANLLGIIFLVPLYFNIYIYSTFELDKIVLFRILVELGLFLYFVKILLAGEIKIPNGKGFFVAMLIILLSQVISVFFSEHGVVASWGTYARNFGLFTYAHFYIFAYLVFVYLSVNKKGYERIIWSTSLSGFFISVYGLVQATGHDFLKWQTVTTGAISRVSSTLGQPNYLGSYLLLVIPLSVYIFLKTKKVYLKIFSLLILSVELLCLLATYSRAAWLGLLFATTILLFIFLYQKKRKLFYSTLISLFLALVFFLYLGFVQPTTISPDSKLNFPNRVKSLTNIYQGSSMIRLYYYNASLQIIKSAPFVGYGLDTQQYYFFNFYRPDYAVYEAINSFNDRAHNELLDILITGGILGVLTWLFLLTKIVQQSYLFYKNNLEKEERVLAACLLFGLTALGISLMFGFFTLVLFVYFWLFCAMLFSLYAKKQEVKSVEFKGASYVFIVFLLFWFALTLFVVWSYNIRPVMASYYYRKALQADFYKNYSESFRLMNKTIEYLPEETFYHAQFAGQLLSQATNSIEALNFAKDLLERDLNNLIPQGKMNLVVVFSNIARLKIAKGESAVVETVKAEELLKELIKEAPGFSHFYFDWGNLYYYQKKYNQALSMYYEALGTYPDLQRLDMNNEHRQQVIGELVYVYAGVIDVKIAQKKYEQALKLCKKALELSPANEILNQRLLWLDTVSLNNEFN